MTLLTLATLLLGSSASAATLSTTTAGGNGSQGAMFEVSASQDLNITKLSSYSYSSYASGCAYLVYTTTSTLSTVLTDPSAWTEVASGTTGALTTGVPWDFTLASPISMTAGDKISFYITFTSCTIQYTNGTTVSTPYASDSNMTIYEGYGRSYSATFSGSVFGPRVWNGTITYDACTPVTWYKDGDGDGFGDAGVSTSACSMPTGYAALGTDCDDNNAAEYPGADEYCDGDDDDCDGSIDESTAVDAKTWYADDDTDSYGDAAVSVVQCYMPAGYVAGKTDCDDSDSAAYPGATEYCDGDDDDCDGDVDEASAVDVITWYSDLDSDGYGDSGSSVVQCNQPSAHVADATDCNDGVAAINPGATEICDPADTDEDCDSLAEDADSSVSAASKTTWYLDGDGDGYGSLTTGSYCNLPAGYAAAGTDCNDSEATIHPGATEFCDSLDTDEDCNGLIDDEDPDVFPTSFSIFYADLDEDGWGDPDAPVAACDASLVALADDSDCDDEDETVNPDATELVGDGIDQDCDTIELCFVDFDGDGWSTDDNIASTDLACDGEGEAADTDPAGDCDDTDAAFHPGAEETDCTDPNDYNCDGSVGYADDDGDSFAACEDCDDASNAVYPGATELAGDALDQDCDGFELCFIDQDDDGYRPDETSTVESTNIACNGAGEATAADGVDDCDDLEPSVYPGAEEVAGDGIDQDCDSSDLPLDNEPDDTASTDSGGKDGSGCACSTRSGGAAGGLLVGLLALGLRRRRTA